MDLTGQEIQQRALSAGLLLQCKLQAIHLLLQHRGITLHLVLLATHCQPMHHSRQQLTLALCASAAFSSMLSFSRALIRSEASQGLRAAHPQSASTRRISKDPTLDMSQRDRHGRQRPQAFWTCSCPATSSRSACRPTQPISRFAHKGTMIRMHRKPWCETVISR